MYFRINYTVQYTHNMDHHENFLDKTCRLCGNVIKFNKAYPYAKSAIDFKEVIIYPIIILYHLCLLYIINILVFSVCTVYTNCITSETLF